MREHRHQVLLQHIVDIITESPTTIHIHKVKAHIGITGNEKADAIAKRVASHPRNKEDRTDIPPSNNRRTQHWIAYKPTPTEEIPDPDWKPIPSLGDHLQGHMQRTHKLGNSNLNTCYYSMWQKELPNMMPRESNLFMTSQDITMPERRITLQYRTGQLYNNKLGKRYGYTPTDKCPLCGEPDGGHHIASGCKALKGAYMERHHKAGRIILKAILKGEKAAEVAYADVGSKEHCSKEGIPMTDSRHNIRIPNRMSRPDIILAHKSKENNSQTTSIILAEIKFCRDTDTQQQLRQATTQHTKLQQHLQKRHGCSVRVEPILLGASGAIYERRTRAALETLGVFRSNLKHTIRNLHHHAIRSLRSITCMRRKLERTGKGNTRPTKHSWERRHTGRDNKSRTRRNPHHISKGKEPKPRTQHTSQPYPHLHDPP
jgi:hypothetical protein